MKNILRKIVKNIAKPQNIAMTITKPEMREMMEEQRNKMKKYTKEMLNVESIRGKGDMENNARV